jgi:hypothetical protein
MAINNSSSKVDEVANDVPIKSHVFATKHAKGDAPIDATGVPAANGVPTVNGVTVTNGAAFRDTPAYKPRRLRVVTIGAGYSGLTLAHKFQHQHAQLQGFIEHTIYEARSELGGTWLVNTYPGVVCDVPSHIYVG